MRVRFRKVALLGALVGALGLVGIANRAEAADPPQFTLPPFSADAGVLHLHMGGTSDFFRYDAKSGSSYVPGTPEPLITSSCLVVAPVPSSMTITSTPNGGATKGAVGLVSHSIGVSVKGEGNGTPCGQVNGTSQSLDLTLAGTLLHKTMDFAELDIEGKFAVKVKAELYMDNTLVGTEFHTTGGPDSGPDSNSNDNFRFRMPAASPSQIVFNRIKLSVDPSTPSGAFSVEGGSDWAQPKPGSYGASLTPPTSDSLFHITDAEGVLGCGGNASEGGTVGAPTIAVTLQNTPPDPSTGDQGCKQVPYLLTASNDSGTQVVGFQKLGGEDNVYNATLIWPVETSAYPIPPTQISYADGSLHPLLWCNGTNLAPIALADEPWCLYDHQTVSAGTGLMKVTEKLLGKGDPVYAR